MVRGRVQAHTGRLPIGAQDGNPGCWKKSSPLPEKKRGIESPLDQTSPQLVANFFEK